MCGGQYHCDIRMRTPPDNLSTSRETTRSSRHTIPYRSTIQYNTSNYIPHVSSTFFFSRSHEKLSSASVDPVREREPLNRSSGSTQPLFLLSLIFLISPFSRGEVLLCVALCILFFILFFSLSSKNRILLASLQPP